MSQGLLGRLAPSLLLGFPNTDVRPTLDHDRDHKCREIGSWYPPLREFQILQILIDDVQLGGCILLYSWKKQQNVVSLGISCPVPNLQHISRYVLSRHHHHHHEFSVHLQN